MRCNLMPLVKYLGLIGAGDVLEQGGSTVFCDVTKPLDECGVLFDACIQLFDVACCLLTRSCILVEQLTLQ